MYQFLDGKDKHVFGRFTTGTLVNPKEHASFIIMDGALAPSREQSIQQHHPNWMARQLGTYNSSEFS
jgi:hypothetical protein